MKRIFRLILAGSCVMYFLSNKAYSESPRRLERKAKQFYHQGKYAEAANQFGLAQEQARGSSLDPAVAFYNRARALTELGNHEEAAQQYLESHHTTDLTLLKKAYHNRGNVLFRKAELIQLDQAHVDEAIRTVHEARTMYKTSITLDPGDPAPRINYELASRRLDELETLQQRLEQRKNKRQHEQRIDDHNAGSNRHRHGEPSDRQSDEQQQDQKESDHGSSLSKNQHPPSQPSSQDESLDVRSKRSEEMTEEEANMLLNSIQEEEKATRANLRITIGQPREVERDW